jgi:hypothetical protein
MVPQMHFTRAGLDCDCGGRQRIVCAAHVAAARRTSCFVEQPLFDSLLKI